MRAVKSWKQWLQTASASGEFSLPDRLGYCPQNENSSRRHWSHRRANLLSLKYVNSLLFLKSLTVAILHLRYCVTMLLLLLLFFIMLLFLFLLVARLEWEAMRINFVN